MEETYNVKSYYSIDHNGHPYGLEDCETECDYGNACEFMWSKLTDGLYVEVQNVETGETGVAAPNDLDFESDEILWVENVIYKGDKD